MVLVRTCRLANVPVLQGELAFWHLPVRLSPQHHRFKALLLLVIANDLPHPPLADAELGGDLRHSHTARVQVLDLLAAGCFFGKRLACALAPISGLFVGHGGMLA